MHNGVDSSDIKKHASGMLKKSFLYEELPPVFYREVAPTSFPTPQPFAINKAHANQLNLSPEWLQGTQGAKWLSGDAPHAIAMAYSGHQFGHFSPVLGDGRARLVGELTDTEGVIHDVHLKGAGMTPFSRGGDGKATLGSAIREYIVSEAMSGLGLPTTRSLAVITTGENVLRQSGHLPGAVLARTALSHIRVGTFQYAMASGDLDNVIALANVTIDRLYPEAPQSGPARFKHFFSEVAKRQARLIAGWMSFGFIHGVMNTDNMAISGETIDYGPCAFIDEFKSDKVFSSIDSHGRYAWNQQQLVGRWNLARFAETLLPLFEDKEDEQLAFAYAVLDEYTQAYEQEIRNRFSGKLGLGSSVDTALIEKTFSSLSEGKVDFTRFFTALTRHVHGEPRSIVLEVFSDPDVGHEWYENWLSLIGSPNDVSSDAKSSMRQSNPIRTARNHQVELVIREAELGASEPFWKLVGALADPFSEDAAFKNYETAPTPSEIVSKTYCGT